MTAVLPFQRNRDSMTVDDGLNLLYSHKKFPFAINDNVAEFVRNQIRIHVVLRDDHHPILHISLLRFRQPPMFMHISGGIEIDGEFRPYTVATVVKQALKFAQLIAANELEVKVLA